MNLHLINAPALPAPGLDGIEKGELGETMYPPLGILYLASFIRSNLPEINLHVTDGLVIGKADVLQEIRQFHPQIIGISCTTANATGAYDLSRAIKTKYPHILVILGGIHPTSVPEDTLRQSKADFVALGEGEKILFEIARIYSSSYLSDLSDSGSSLQDIPGLAYLKKGHLAKNPLMPLIQNLDKIPFPARDLLDLKKYSGWVVGRARPETSIISTRGCPYHCHFCSNLVWKLQKPYLRLRSPQNVLDEVAELIQIYGIKEYFDQADEINSSMEWLALLCQEKIKREITIPWKAMLRADKMTPKLARLLKQSNCWYVHLGIESGNQKTLYGIGKHITLEQVETCCRMLKQEGIKICGLFMLFNAWEETIPIGTPSSKTGGVKISPSAFEAAGMTKEKIQATSTTNTDKKILRSLSNPLNSRLAFESVYDSENTLKFARSLLKKGLIDNLTWSQTTPYPGSALYDTALKYRLIPEKFQDRWEYWNHSWGFVMDLPGITPTQRSRLKNIGVIMQTWSLIKTGHLPLNSFPYLLKRGIGLIKRLLTI